MDIPWKEWEADVVGGAINCGHYVPEEAPEETYAWFARFFGRRSAEGEDSALGM